MNVANIVKEAIAQRRTIKPESCTQASIPDADVWEILASANWAPTHGYTEPWRFVVFTGVAKHTFSKEHAEMYKAHTSEDNFRQLSYDKMLERAFQTSHIIALINRRGNNPKIPLIEEIQATAMAIQNMQLLASVMGYGAYIYSGGMTFHPAMHQYFSLEKEDEVLGFLYLGVPNDEERAPGRRITPIQEKVIWKS